MNRSANFYGICLTPLKILFRSFLRHLKLECLRLWFRRSSQSSSTSISECRPLPSYLNRWGVLARSFLCSRFDGWFKKIATDGFLLTRVEKTSTALNAKYTCYTKSEYVTGCINNHYMATDHLLGVFLNFHAPLEVGDFAPIRSRQWRSDSLIVAASKFADRLSIRFSVARMEIL